MDFLRESTTDYFRPFQDSPLLVKRRWFPVPEGTPILPFPTAFMSSRWEPFPWRPRRVGDVFPPDPTYSIPGALTGFTYKHYCGTPEQFARGAVFDADFRAVLDEDWIPECCERENVCVFNLCETLTVNNYPATQAVSFPIPQATADGTTPAYVQQFTLNQDDTDPPTNALTLTYYPGGTDNDAGATEQYSANADGSMRSHQFTVRLDADTATTTRQDADGWALDLETADGSGTLSASIVNGVATLGGTNAQLALGILPPFRLPRDTQVLEAVGTDQDTAAPVTAASVQLFSSTANAGVVLPTELPGATLANGAVLTFYLPSTNVGGSVQIYPGPSGHRWIGQSLGTPRTMVAGKAYLVAQVLSRRWAWVELT